MSERPLKQVLFIGSSRQDLREFPEAVRADVGHALHIAQRGGRSVCAKTLTGFGSAGVLEIIEDNDGNAYRAVYTVKFENAVYVLHCFQKKSKHGVGVPARDREQIVRRLAAAESDHRPDK